jgi:hypothetical protein
MLGIGRFGGILGAFSGAFLMQAQLSFVTIFTLLSIPAFLSAIALLVKYKISKSQPIPAQAKPKYAKSLTLRPAGNRWPGGFFICLQKFSIATRLMINHHLICRFHPRISVKTIGCLHIITTVTILCVFSDYS